MEKLNEQRAGWARDAIDAFEKATGTEGEESVSDLISDLGHLCDQEGFDFEMLVERGVRNHEEEKGRDGELDG